MPEPRRSRRKYLEGDPFPGIFALIEWLELRRPVYWRGTWKHHRVMENVSLVVLRHGVIRGSIRPAVPLEDADHA